MISLIYDPERGAVVIDDSCNPSITPSYRTVPHGYFRRVCRRCIKLCRGGTRSYHTDIGTKDLPKLLLSRGFYRCGDLVYCEESAINVVMVEQHADFRVSVLWSDDR